MKSSYYLCLFCSLLSLSVGLAEPTNIAPLYGVVLVDTYWDNRVPQRAIDGDPGTEWSAGWYATPSSPHWLIVDLQNQYNVTQITVSGWPYGGDPYFGYTNIYNLYTSTNGTDWALIASDSWAEDPDPSIYSNTYILSGESLRYVKYEVIGGTHWAGLGELEIYADITPKLYVVIPGMNDGIDNLVDGCGGWNMIQTAMVLSEYRAEYYVKIIQASKKGGIIQYWDPQTNTEVERRPSDKDFNNTVRETVVTIAREAVKENCDIVVGIDMNLQYSGKYQFLFDYWFGEVIGGAWYTAVTWTGETANVVSAAFREVCTDGRRRLYSHSAGGDATYEAIKAAPGKKMFEDINILNGRTNAKALSDALSKAEPKYNWWEVKIFTSKGDLLAMPKVGYMTGSIANKDVARASALGGHWTHLHCTKVYDYEHGKWIDPGHSGLRDNYGQYADFELYTPVVDGRSLTDWTFLETVQINWSF